MFPGAFAETVQVVSETAVQERPEYWVKQKVSFNTPSADDRVVVYLFLPTQAVPPYQALMLFPGLILIPFSGQRPSDGLQPGFAEFHVRAGRALVLPILIVQMATANRDWGYTRIRDARPQCGCLRGRRI